MAEADYEVAIVGGGPAGSSLAVQLALRGRSVLLLEKAIMPSDKLCGEFLSMEVSGLCEKLGVLREMQAQGARLITRARCTTPAGVDLKVDLPGTAMALSRRAFDKILFERAADVGVHAVDGTAVQAIKGSLDAGFHLEAEQGKTYSASVVIGAYGRREVLDRKLERSSMRTRSPYVAFKAHFEGESPAETVEVHTFRGGYCGVLAAEERVVNVCWIVHRDRLTEAGGTPEELMVQMKYWSEPLGNRLGHLARTKPFHAVSQLDFRRKELFAKDVCLIGDAAGMIAPLCGDGMGMAMETADIAAPLIEQIVDGRIRTDEFRAAYRRRWKRAFSKRMAAGRVLHALFVRPPLFNPGLRLAGRAPHLAQAVVSMTRG